MPQLKVCSRCHNAKPIHGFYVQKHWRTGKPSRAAICKTCRSEYARAHKKPKLDKERARRAKAGTHLLAYLKTHPCVQCGESDPIVLDFDHVRDVKHYSVTYMVSHQFGLKSIQAEMDKCQILCANCHRRKTAKEQNGSRLRDYNPL